MAYSLEKKGELKLRIGEAEVRVYFRRPGPEELIETLVQKMPRGDEDEDARRVLMANLHLGRECIIGIGDGDLVINDTPLVSDPDRPGHQSDWLEALAESCPLILVALGQHLSAVPAFVSGEALKKTSPTPGRCFTAG